MAYATIPASSGGTITVTANTGLTGDGSNGTPLAGVPASALVPGSMSIADFNKLTRIPTGAFGMTAIVSDVIDFAATGVTNVSPAVPGYGFVAVSQQFVLTTVSGSLLVTSVVKAGNDGSRVNICSSQSSPTAAHFALGKNSVNTATGATKPVVFIDLTTPITFEVVTAATTGTSIVFQGRLILYGFLTPIT